MGTNHARTPSHGSAVDDKWIEVLKRTTSHEIDQLQQRGFSRPFALSLLFQCANMIYEQYYQRERVPATIFKPMMQYLRNWTLIRDNLIPALDQVAITAKNFVNEEYASIVLDLARMYPFPDSSGRFPTLRHQGSGGLGDGDRIFLKSRLGRKPRSWTKLPIRHHPKERFPGEWKSAWGDQPHGLYSYPPEDIIEESFFDHLRKKTMSILQDRRVRILEFTSSLLDGIDVRETIRHLALQKLFVRESYPLKGKVGSVVIIFSDDDGTSIDENRIRNKDGNETRHDPVISGGTVERGERFPNKVTWWAEHEQESDMAFYGTPPSKNLIGPGIARIELGGVLSIYPPRGIPNVWTYFEPVAGKFTKAEILMLGAVEFSRETYIPVVSKQPPSKRLEAIAGRHGKTFVHVPIWTLSKEALEDVRFVHVLRNKRVRQYASEYIFL
ncbi:hypothetical protein GF325_07480 [Candidatus Bathyarchaeota archaeon]|nr:hypothetical protein [Candidatus Bathyarchaeota archaeon]